MNINTTSRRLLVASAGCLAGLTSLAAHAEPTWTPMGFAQLTAEHRDDQNGIDFGGDRIRAGARYSSDTLFGGLVLDFNVPDAGNRTPGTLNNIIKDVWAGWHLNRHWSVKGGQFKAPVGMDFNVPGHRLDITKRGLEKPLVLERAVGAMLSGRKLGGHLGVDVGIFNPAGRSGAVATPASGEGEHNAYAIRGLLDAGPWHAQISAGRSESAGLAPRSADYTVVDAGLRWAQGPWTLKAEWIAGDNVLGTDGREQTVAYAHAGWRLRAPVELVARHYSGRSELPDGARFDLDNTYLGVNLTPQALEHASLRVQINYLIAGGDRPVGNQFLAGFRDDAILTQVQIAYR